MQGKSRKSAGARRGKEHNQTDSGSIDDPRKSVSSLEESNSEETQESVNGFGNPLSLPDHKPSIKDTVRKTRHDSELSNTDSICQKHASDVDK